jgi:hypothetical protein
LDGGGGVSRKVRVPTHSFILSYEQQWQKPLLLMFVKLRTSI